MTGLANFAYRKIKRRNPKCLKTILPKVIGSDIDNKMFWTSNLLDKQNAWVYDVNTEMPQGKKVNEKSDLIIFGRIRL